MSFARVGLTGMEKVIRLGVDRRSAQPFSARLECFLEPAPAAGRFEAAIRDAVREIVLGTDGVRAERLAQQLAEWIRDSLGVRRATVAIAARFPERPPAPVTLHAGAEAGEHGTRWTVGVSVQGATSSPYSPAFVARARERLEADGFSQARAARALERIPAPTRSRLAVGTLHLGCPASSGLEFDAGDLLAIVEAAMSSDLVESVRAMIAGVIERYAGVPDDVFVSAAQEATHRHHGVAARAGLLGELRRELTA